MNDKKIGMISLGCAKNHVNSEQMLFLLKEAGFEVPGGINGVDAVVVNTCSFIEDAKMEAIETIIELGQMKAEGRIGRIIVAGCLPERYKGEIMPQMPEIDAVVGTGSFDEIVNAVKTAIEGKERVTLFGDLSAPVSETERIITTSPAWAYLKIAEGCDNRCAFCVIPGIRGRYRSRQMENILSEARKLAENGSKELIIVSQDTTKYGYDLYGKRRLKDLLAGLCDIQELKWIRLHYLHPQDIDDELINHIAGNDKILKYLDLPIQHVSDEILRKMRRRGTGEGMRALIGRIRAEIPGVVLRTSIIAGLPGEGEKEFGELCDFLNEVKIERTGVFKYSPEEGTDAALMDRPDPDTAAAREEILINLQQRVLDRFNESRIGSVTPVLIEGQSGDCYYGRSYAESPDVDGYITVESKNLKLNNFYDVRITGAEMGELEVERSELEVQG